MFFLGTTPRPEGWKCLRLQQAVMSFYAGPLSENVPERKFFQPFQRLAQEWRNVF